MNALTPVSEARAGMAVCVCPPDTAAGVSSFNIREIGSLSAGAAASVLSQALMFSLLPLVGQNLAPDARLAGVPFVALFVGAIAATFPAAILTDAFGRRAAFALGASLGVAGGLVVAWGLLSAAFWPLVVGAFWIGIANGFALQYRHAAAAGALPAATLAIVVGAGALIGFAAPALTGLFEARLTPIVGAGAALLAAAAHVAALGAALATPPRAAGLAAAPTSSTTPNDWLFATLVGGAAWFGMMAVMAFAPLGLALCGVGFSATVGIISWHLVAMYAPALGLGALASRFGMQVVALGGLLLVILGAAVIAIAPSAWVIMAALMAVGAGWSLATAGAVLALHRAHPSRLAIGAHDACILLGGVTGALVSGNLF
jgi:MFS family permease